MLDPFWILGEANTILKMPVFSLLAISKDGVSISPVLNRVYARM